MILRAPELFRLSNIANVDDHDVTEYSFISLCLHLNYSAILTVLARFSMQ